MSEEKLFVDPSKQALLDLGIMDETPLETIERVFTAKSAEYGNSWCKRGELAFVASMARKVDRLETCTPGTVGAFDTKLDLVAYLALYNVLLKGNTSEQLTTETLFKEFVHTAARVVYDPTWPSDSYLVKEIVCKYGIFYLASVRREVRSHPERHGIKALYPYSSGDPSTIENLAFAWAQGTLQMAWMLYRREHEAIKALCK